MKKESMLCISNKPASNPSNRLIEDVQDEAFADRTNDAFMSSKISKFARPLNS
jgi:hypothetical protein